MKKCIYCALAVLPLLLFNSCFNLTDLEIPESVSLKTDATYRASIGEKSIDFSDKINLNELLGNNTPDGYNVYDYLPANDSSSTAGLKKFLIEAKLQEIELDFSRIFENSTIDTAIQGASFSQDIRVPSIGFNVTQAAVIPNLSAAIAAQQLMNNGDTQSINVNFNTTYTPTIDSSIKDCVIGTGSIIVSITEPDGWENLRIVSVSVSQTGGISVSDSPNATSTTIDLAGENVSSNQLTLTATISADISKTTNLNNPPAVTARSEITQFETVTVDLGDNFNPNLSANFDLSDEMVNSIDEITFASGTGIRGSYVNNLPEVTGSPNANKITLSASSSFLGLSSSSADMLAGGNSGNISLLSSSEHTETISNTNKRVDFTGTLSLPGASSSHPTYLTAQKLVPGTTYHVGVNIEPVINWSSVTIKDSALGSGSSLSDNIVLNNLDIGGMLDEFGNKLNITHLGSQVSFTELPFYLYCQLPSQQISSLNDISMNATIYAYRGNSSGASPSNQTYIVGTSSGPADLESHALPVLSKNSNGVVTTNLDNVPSTTTSDLATVINAVMDNSGSCLCLHYDITTSLGSSGSGLTITKAELDSISSTRTSISIYAYIVLPLSLSVENDINVDVLKMIEMDDKEDLFDRSEATSVSDMEKYLNAIEAATVIYKPSRLPFVSQNNLAVTIDLDGDEQTVNGETQGNNFSTETLYLSGGQISVNPTLLLTTYPLKPKIEMVIPQGQFGISADLSFAMNVQAAVKTNGTIKLFGGQ